MTRQAMGEFVVDLERLGDVDRCPDPDDGRAKLDVLTPKGEAAIAVGIAAVVALESRWRIHRGEPEARVFRTVLATLNRTFGSAHIR